MRPDSAALVRASWAVLARQADAVAADFYLRLRALDPAAAAHFAHVDMTAQRRKFVAMIDLLVRVLDDPALLVREAAATGRRHARHALPPAAYAHAGTALLQALATALGGAWTPAVRDAWRELYALLATVMQRAEERAGEPEAVR